MDVKHPILTDAVLHTLNKTPIDIYRVLCYNAIVERAETPARPSIVAGVQPARKRETGNRSNGRAQGARVSPDNDVKERREYNSRGYEPLTPWGA